MIYIFIYVTHAIYTMSTEPQTNKYVEIIYLSIEHFILVSTEVQVHNCAYSDDKRILVMGFFVTLSKNGSSLVPGINFI